MINNQTIATEIIVEEPRNYRKFKKTLWNGTEWETMYFYELKQTTELLDWLQEHYKNKRYSNTWWTTFNSIAMNEKIYIHWKLCE